MILSNTATCGNDTVSHWKRDYLLMIIKQNFQKNRHPSKQILKFIKELAFQETRIDKLIPAFF